jgi:hypothetical protein
VKIEEALKEVGKKKKAVVHYQNRIVAFIDLLGFKDIINGTVVDPRTDNPEEIRKVRQLLLRIRRSLKIDEDYRELYRSKRITQFSDSVVISFRFKEESAVFWTLFEIQCLIVEIVHSGFLCRGALTSGKLTHTSKLLFGPAFIKAYLTESKKAVYPRIIVDPEVIKVGSKFRHEDHTHAEERESIMDMLTEDSDGLYYVDYFEKAFDCLDDAEYDAPVYIGKIKEIIERNIDNDDPKIRQKYEWLRTKYNEMIRPYGKKKFLNSLDDRDLYEFYEGLKKL